MIPTDPCPKCNSDKIIRRLRIIDRGHLNDDAGELTVVFYEDPDAMIFKGAHKASLFARVCGECGYTEMFLEDPQEFYAAYRESVENPSEE